MSAQGVGARMLSAIARLNPGWQKLFVPGFKPVESAELAR